MGKEFDLLTFSVNDFITAIDKIMADVARDFGEKMQAKFILEIQYFYSSYTPRSYKRTYSMFEFSSGTGKKTFFKNGKLSYTAGIEVSPRFIAGNPYAKNHGIKVTPEDIFEISYEKGIHGFNYNNIYMRRKVTNRDKDGNLLPRDPITGEPTVRVEWVRKTKTVFDKNGNPRKVQTMYIPGYNIREINGNSYNLTLNSYAKKELERYKKAYEGLTGNKLENAVRNRKFREFYREAKNRYNFNDHIPKPKGGYKFKSPDREIRAYYKELGRQVGEKMDAAFIRLVEGL